MEDNYESYLYTDQCSTEGYSEYNNRIKIGPNLYEVVFVVQDMNKGSDVQGHMTITIHSSHTQDEHTKMHDAIMKNKIETTKQQNKILDAQIEQMDRDKEDEDWWIEDRFRYA